MHLARLIYVSRVSPGFDKDMIEQILESARRNNKALQVSGLLIFSTDYFIQCLEGGPLQVNQIYHKILNDQRHFSPLIVDYGPTNQREFGHWAMAYAPNTAVTKEILLKYSANDIFLPFDMSGKSIFKLMCEIRDVYPAI